MASKPRRFTFHGLRVLHYPTARNIVEEFWSQEGLQWSQKRRFYDGRGWTKADSGREMLAWVRRKGRWGFVRDKHELHIWLRRNHNFADTVVLLAHEYGHLMGPWHRNPEREESKAGQYESVAYSAIVLARRLDTKRRG